MATVKDPSEVSKRSNTSHAKYAGKFTTAGGDANEQISVAGVVAGTDIVVVSLQDKGATPRTILTAKPGTNVIDLVFWL